MNVKVVQLFVLWLTQLWQNLIVSYRVTQNVLRVIAVYRFVRRIYNSLILTVVILRTVVFMYLLPVASNRAEIQKLRAEHQWEP